jgi:anti-sigma-K factor RskA
MCDTTFTGALNGCAKVRWLKGYGIIAMRMPEEQQEHGRFRTLCGLAQSNLLSARERRDLDRHLLDCDECRRLCEEYAHLGDEGMAVLLAEEALNEDAMKWDNRAARERLQAAIHPQRPQRVLAMKPARPSQGWSMPKALSSSHLALGAVAAAMVVALAFGAYRLGQSRGVAVPQLSASVPPQKPPVLDKPTSVDSTVEQGEMISKLEKQIAGEEQKIAELRAATIVADERVSALGTLSGEKEADLRQRTAERDQLASQLAEKEKAFEILQADYSTLRAEHSRSLLHTASLESDAIDLRAQLKEQQHHLQDDEQYLSSDRDIRELMGARKLYIADVFDVDSGSHTRKPFGRVFYTQSKSLVFYAFDLDHQPGVKNASVFQVWGQRDAESNGTPNAMNLGILYMDSETNRRWTLRSDDPNQLARIDAVFVTVEPHGGSQKPTGKPLLYALLRQEANHP